MGLNHDQAATERTYRRIDRIVKIDQSILALRTERQRLVRENEEDEWRSAGGKWHGRTAVSPDDWRNRMRFRIRLQPSTNAA